MMDRVKFKLDRIKQDLCPYLNIQLNQGSLNQSYPTEGKISMSPAKKKKAVKPKDLKYQAYLK